MAARVRQRLVDLGCDIRPAGGFTRTPCGYLRPMSTYRHSAVADIPADEMFAFLSDPRNLPRYFPQLTVAEPAGGAGGGEVRIEADVQGRRVTGEAWLHTNDAHRTLAWGSKNEDNYHGELRI